MTKASELREMSDEQLALTLQGSRREPVPAADPGADRAARRPQRAAQAAAADRPGQDHSNPACGHGRRQSRSKPSYAQETFPIGVVTSDKMAKTRRVEIPRLVRHAEVRQDSAPQDGLPRARRDRTSRTWATRSRSSSRGRARKTKRWELVRVVTKSRLVDIAAMRAAAETRAKPSGQRRRRPAQSLREQADADQQRVDCSQV